MGSHWRNLDLAGGGLQSANLRLAALLRKRATAYALIALFPLGLHRDYLHDRAGGWLYRGATLAGIALLVFGYPIWAGGLLAAETLFAVRDLLRTENVLVSVNKRLRMDVYLHHTAGAPAGFRGHFTDSDVPEANAGEDAASRSPERAPSFAEQERRLREFAARRKNQDPESV